MTSISATYRPLLFIILLLIINKIHAQQDAQYTQYMYNMSVINPAYATDDESRVNLGGLYRAQWVGAVGGPQTGTFFAHTPLSEKVEIGLSVVNDNIGDVVSDTNLSVDFAYVLKFGKHKLSLGLKGGLSFYETDFNGFRLTDPNPDPAFANNISKIFPNIGTGVFYFSDKYYVGLSAPNLLKSEHLEKSEGIYTTGVEEIHYFLTGGYVFTLSDNFKLKPAFMAKTVSGSPTSFDVTLNALVNNNFEIGVAHRLEDSFSGLVNFRILPDLRIGYAYDHTISNLGKFNSGSHEIFILFDLNKSGFNKNKGYDKSPRFF